MFEGVDTVVLHDELAYHDTLPLEWEARDRPIDSFELNGIEESNALLLQALVAVEEHPVRETAEEHSPLAHDIARLDFKLNLVLQLLGSLMNRSGAATACTVRFNALGASWTAAGAPPAPGTRGVLRIRMRGSLPQALSFPAEVTRVQGQEVGVRYLQLSEPVAELIQKLCFLQHRKQVADKRKSRVL